MWYLLAAAYGEDVYNNTQVYAATTDTVADSGAGGGLADTGIFAVAFILIGATIIALTVLAQYRRKQVAFVANQ